MTAHQLTPSLAHGVGFDDLYDRDGLVRLDAAFVAWLQDANVDVHARFLAARSAPDSLATKDEANLLIEVARSLEDFVAGLFGVSREASTLRAGHVELAPLYDCKRLFVQRYVTRAIKADAAATLVGAEVTAAIKVPARLEDGLEAWELAFALAVRELVGAEFKVEAPTPEIEALTRYAAWALHSPEGKRRHREGPLFKVPHKLDFEHLVPIETEVVDGVTRMKLPRSMLRHREGFALTDAGYDLVRTVDHTNYCIWCHNQGKDSCSKGLKDRKTGEFQKSPFGVTLAGCPLEERISEMNLLKSEGFSIGALATAMVDNPLLAATGHRICNDCMKACIYQKQEPVDIPQIETRTLKDVLGLPWGFEIYSLLTRWNPLNLRRPIPRPATGRSVLVVGLGPAGFNLAHHLMNDGHTVVAIDGLKIEPLPPEQSGVKADGGRVPFVAVKDIATLRENLGERAMAGFGGVAEYGITVRWDKNYLKLVRLLLERRNQFSMFGGVRFGGTVTVEDAFALGFDHIALCAGAGKPTVLDMPNGLARGVRAASDFLMALQLTGAAKKESIANLQVRLPVVVIGGGLTAIDTATESLAYYPLQVEKFLARHETLVAERGETAVRAGWSEEEREIADEFIAHAKAIRAERAAAAKEGREPEIAKLVNGWGGVTVVYRRRLIESPSYTLNHEEVLKALEEDIRFAEGLSPTAVEVDANGHAKALVAEGQQGGEKIKATLPARTILVAAGTQPNTVLAREDATHAFIDGKYFRALDEDGEPATPERVCKPRDVRVLMYRHADGRFMSFFGDLHPSFAGNVVKAMGGAKQGYPILTRSMARLAAPKRAPADILAEANRLWRAKVVRVERLTPTIVEVVVEAPAAARNFEPGQFYRLQNYEARSRKIEGTLLTMEGLALTGAWVDKEKGLLSLIALEMGGSSDLCALLEPGEPVIVMGPTGAPTEIEPGETVVLAGGGLGNAVLFSIGQAFRKAGSKVLYFAGYKRVIDRYKVDEIEAAADVVVWCCDEAPGFAPSRPQDKSTVDNIVETMRKYAAGELGEQPIPFNDADRIIAIGSDGMMNAVRLARHSVLKPYLKPDHRALGSINSPMQCMMKEICAQCLQLHKDPVTGKETVVFSCFNQDQELDRVDFGCLRQRLRQNSVQEKIAAQWLNRSLQKLGIRR
ncbi:NADPH-dependent glutamate synthase beta chain [Enhydrobacter aerosaccus]|uniref:NADPH-dependent glutamate synthase beta chain n=1 Tax=Enhydrobacter aerosaccus TaxID=225324 RepID=A0A1T4MZ44_9HYPH|nr:FAD-dependent oxidoreductase [Enhydrobacter aerosaccus]SJZ72171.1 NADPH-dependent glutamate synthase beta chain [Enhydrobacter aerosaccus]